MSILLAFALAVTPLSDPQAESRARALENELRCVVCESEPISQSGADAAQDMRRLVRERIAAGDSDREVRRYFADRYGDYVLLRPPVKPATLPLYLAPVVFLLAAGFAFWTISRRARPDAPVEADSAEAEPDER